MAPSQGSPARRVGFRHGGTMATEPSGSASGAPAASQPPPLPPWTKAVAGMCGGVVEAFVLQPVDTIKTRIQLDRIGAYRGVYHCGSTMVRDEGALALYKGLQPFTLQLVAKYAFRFGSFHWFKEKLGLLASRLGLGDRKDSVNFFAGLAAGTTEAVAIVTPSEVVKTRLQASRFGGGVADGASPMYRGPMHCATTIVREEGWRALMRGVVPTIIRQGSNQSCNFMLFSSINRNLWGASEDNESKHSSLKSWQLFCTGLMSSTVGPMLNCPMDVLKTRMMAASSSPDNSPHSLGLLGATKAIVREEGVSALWKGLTARLMRLAPGQAITWVVVMKVTSLMEERNRAAFRLT